MTTMAVHSLDYQSAKIHLYLANGDETFTDGTAGISGSSWPNSSFSCSTKIGSNNSWPAYLRSGDFDGDRRTDFALSFGGIGSCGGIIYLGDGKIDFFAPQPLNRTQRSISTPQQLEACLLPL
jgi:hypothetical protein